MTRAPLVVRLWRLARKHYQTRLECCSFVAGVLIGLWLLWLRALPYRRTI